LHIPYTPYNLADTPIAVGEPHTATNPVVAVYQIFCNLNKKVGIRGAFGFSSFYIVQQIFICVL